MRIHVTSLKGLRDANEDKHAIKTYLSSDNENNEFAKVNYYGIYDGHGGKFVSNYLYNNLHTFFVDKRVKYPLTKLYVNNAYNCLQKNLETTHPKESKSCGSTCLVVVHFKEGDFDYLNILNTGDCRAVICKNNIAYALTKDHKPNKPEERCRIQKLGGEIYFDGFDWRISDLSVSRAFGDNESKQWVTHLPDLYKYKLSKKDKFLVMACDGLWDVIDNQDVVDFVLDNCYNMNTDEKINKKENIAHKLADFAIKKGSTDNVTVLVVFFN